MVAVRVEGDFHQLGTDVADILLELAHRRIHARAPGREVVDHRLERGQHGHHLPDGRCDLIEGVLDAEKGLGDVAPLLRRLLHLLLQIKLRHDLPKAAGPLSFQDLTKGNFFCGGRTRL